MSFHIIDSFSKPPNESVGIWRYMNFSQFVSLIIQSELFFSKIANLGDQFEGTWFNSLHNSFQASKTWKKFGYESLEEVTKINRDLLSVNCWHINNYESAAMWNSYLKTNEGIAIKTNLKRMKEAFRNTDQYINGAKMIYADFDNDLLITSPFIPFYTKLKSYEYEQEFRLSISLDYDEKIDTQYRSGKYVPVNINALIDEIYISPNSPQWFVNLINDLLKKFNYNFTIINSGLNDNSLK